MRGRSRSCFYGPRGARPGRRDRRDGEDSAGRGVRATAAETVRCRMGELLGRGRDTSVLALVPAAALADRWLSLCCRGGCGAALSSEQRRSSPSVGSRADPSTDVRRCRRGSSGSRSRAADPCHRRSPCRRPGITRAAQFCGVLVAVPPCSRARDLSVRGRGRQPPARPASSRPIAVGAAAGSFRPESRRGRRIGGGRLRGGPVGWCCRCHHAAHRR